MNSLFESSAKLTPCDTADIIRIMKAKFEELSGPPIWFYPVAIGCALFMLVAIYLLFRQESSPDKALRSYVSALDKGSCRSAYKLVSSLAKQSSDDYRNYKNFKKNVCREFEKRYEHAYISKIREVIITGNTATVDCVLSYKMSFMPSPRGKPVTLYMRRSGGQWKMDGPELVP